MSRSPGSSAGTGTARGGALALGLSLSILAAGCGHKPETARERPAVAVRAATLAAVSEPNLVEAGGSLRAAREADVAGKVMGAVIEIRRHAGDFVRQGEILIVVDNRDVAGQIAQAEGALAQAEAAAALAETNFRRFELLKARGSASQLELDQARYQMDTAAGAVAQGRGAVATARSYRSYAEIPAPFSGRVVDQLCDVGDLAAPGRPLLRLEDPTRLRLFASLDAAKGAAVVVGQDVSVRVPAAGDRAFPGRVTEVVPAADPATRSVLIKIDVAADSALQSGLFARALLPSGRRDVVRLPGTALVRRGGLTGVFVVEDGRAAFRLLVLGDATAGATEVVAGLSGGESIVLDPPPGLEAGSLLEVRS